MTSLEHGSTNTREEARSPGHNRAPTLTTQAGTRGLGVFFAFLLCSPPCPGVARTSGLTRRRRWEGQTDRWPQAGSGGEGTRQAVKCLPCCVATPPDYKQAGVQTQQAGAHPRLLRLPNALSPAASPPHLMQSVAHSCLPLSVPHPSFTLSSCLRNTC